jgi:hypothetical protein
MIRPMVQIRLPPAPLCCEPGRKPGRRVPRFPRSRVAGLGLVCLVAAGGVARGRDPEFESALLQRRVRCEPDADRGARDRGDALSVQSFVALDSVIGGQFIKYLRNPSAQLGSLKRFRQDRDPGHAIVVQCFCISGHEQHFEAGLISSRALYDVSPIHFGHRVIYQQQIQGTLSFEDL